MYFEYALLIGHLAQKLNSRQLHCIPEEYHVSESVEHTTSVLNKSCLLLEPLSYAMQHYHD